MTTTHTATHTIAREVATALRHAHDAIDYCDNAKEELHFAVQEWRQTLAMCDALLAQQRSGVSIATR